MHTALPVNRQNYLVNYSLRFRYIYAEVPKSGCTTIKKLLQLAEFDGDESKLPKNIHDRDASPLLSPAHDRDQFQKSWIDPDFLRFTFVRNPFTRVLSAYLDKLVNNEWERKRRLPLLGFSEDSHPSFIDFLESIRSQAVAEMDIHWAPQVDLVGIPENHFDRVYRFEDFSRSCESVIRYLDAGNDFNQKTQKYVASPPGHATGARERLIQHYSAEEIQLVQEIYANDFNYLGYSFDLNRAS